MFVFILKYYPENFAFLIVIILYFFTRKVCQMFVYKHTETMEYTMLKISLLLKKNTNFTGEELKNSYNQEWQTFRVLFSYEYFQICISVPLVSLHRQQDRYVWFSLYTDPFTLTFFFSLISYIFFNEIYKGICFLTSMTSISMLD